MLIRDMPKTSAMLLTSPLSRTLIVLTLLSLAAVSARAQGKIAGQVTDAETGESLIGVSVLIDGTTQGTVTDIDGNYVIVNVRPDEYALNFSYIGYTTKQITGVRATTGQTTTLDVELSPETIQGAEVVVQADRPLVQKDLTASRVSVVAEELEAYPVEGFLGALAIQAGVSQDAEGGLHIRGGRSNEISFLVDGMSVGNPFETNGLATELPLDAIQEMTVISGAFNAEYGKAMSGIVNLVTKEGGDEYEGSFSAYGGDTFTRHGDIFGTPSSVDLNNYTLEGSFGGPVPLLRGFNFFVSGRRDVSHGTIYGQKYHLPSDSANFNSDQATLEAIREHIPDYDGPAWYYEFHGKPWYEYEDPSTIPNEVVAMNPSSSYNLVGKVSMRPFSGGKVEYSYLRDRSERTPFAFGGRYNPEGVASQYTWSDNHSVHWTHTLNDRSFYTLRTSYATNHLEAYLYEDPMDPRYASTGRIRGFPEYHFVFGGDVKNHLYETANSFRTKFDFTRQFGSVHEAKLGADVQLHRLSRENFTVLFDNDRYDTPTVEPVGSPSHDLYEDQEVTELSAYIQDKLEFGDFIMNAGLRFEHFNPNGIYIQDLLDPTVSREDATPKNMLLPRLGVSFPITERGIIHFSYGHFAQMPTLRQMYINPEFEFPAGSVPTFGNTNMRPERTVQYEVGLQQQVGELMAFDVTGYFKDIRDYLTLQSVQYSTIPGQQQYQIYLNKNYANVRGITFALTQRAPAGGLLSSSIDYTYQVAEGNSENAGAFFFNFLSGRDTELEVVPLDFDQRHIISAIVTLARQDSWGASFISRYATGYPYSPLLIDQNIDELPNSGRKPAQFKMDAHLYKSFAFGGGQVRLFGKVYNVFDNLNEVYVFDDTGRATYSLSDERNLHAAWESAYGLPGIATLEEFETRPHYYSAPRQIRVGVTLTF